MFDLLFIVLQLSLVYGLSGAAVRLALAVQGGFDLTPAVAALIAAEVSIAFGNFAASGTPWAVSLSIGAGLVAGLATGWLWSAISDYLRRTGIDGQGILLVSLGLLVCCGGLIGLIRGPGLRVLEALAGVTISIFGTRQGASLQWALACGLVPLSAGALYLRTRSGFALTTFLMNERFAIELGVNPGAMRRNGLLLAGLFGGGAGTTLALVNGTTPELGLKIFLFGAGAALLFESRTVFAPIVAGVLLGSVHLGLQLILAPAWAEGVMFIGVVALVIAKGNRRDSDGNR